MTDHENDLSYDAVPDRDRLITRVIDGEATPGDWARLSRLASADQGLWAEIAERQADRDALAVAVEHAVRVADAIEADGPWPGRAEPERFGPTWGGVRAWGGWIAAAVVALFMLTRGPVVTMPGAVPGDGLAPATVTAGLDLPASELLDRYIQTGRDEGRVVRADDPIVLDARPAANPDRLEVIVMRQIIERRYVDRAPQFSRNEFGHIEAREVPVESITRGRPAF